jgi:colanic acid/amylovoran biosynthesis glycosyltransferase
MEELSEAPAEQAQSKPASPDLQGCKVGYIMSRFPKLTETFVLFEMIAVERLLGPVEIFPLVGRFSSGKEVAGASLWRKFGDYLRSPAKPEVMHAEAVPYVSRGHYMPFWNLAILWANLLTVLGHPIMYLSTLFAVVRETWRNSNFLWGSIAMFPKCVYFARRVRRLGVNHLHAHFANHPATAAYIIHRLTQLPYSFTAHGSDLHRFKDMLQEKVRRAKFIVAISNSNKEILVDHCGRSYADKIHVIHTGVDVEKFHPPAIRQTSERTRVICVGTLHEVKGQAYLLRAAGILRDKQVPTEVHFVGDGRDYAMLKALTSELGLDSQVVFHGQKTRDQIIELLQSSDLLVAPSVQSSDGRKEGIPVVIMEAMACGLPVVASRISGIPELVSDDGVGRLVAPTDVSGLAAAIQAFAEDGKLREDVGIRARQRVVEQFSVVHSADRLSRLFCSFTT